MNQEIVLYPTDQSAVAFQGRIVAQATGPSADSRLAGRYHQVTVYEADSGELHLQIEFRTECSQEQSQTLVERRILDDEIAEVLLMYDPTEFLNRAAVRLQFPGDEDFHRFVKRIYNQYDALCVSIATQMQTYQPKMTSKGPNAAKVMAGSTSDEKSVGWTAWLRFGKPR